MSNTTIQDNKKNNDMSCELSKKNTREHTQKKLNDAYMSIVVEQVIAMINEGDDDWELLLPSKEVTAIKEGNLFGYIAEDI